jgi:hypothetical protein
MADLFRTKADSGTDAHTPSKRGASLRDMLRPLIVEALSVRGQGMFPSEVTAKLLLEKAPQLIPGINSTNLETQVRVILSTEYGHGKLNRTPAKGPNGGNSHKYTRLDSREDDSNVRLIERVPQLSADVALGSRDRVEHSDNTHVDGSTSSLQQPSEAFHVAQNSHQDPAAENTTGSDHLEHPLDTSASQDQQSGVRRVADSTSEANPWTHEHSDIVEKVLAAKLLVAQLEKVTGGITVLESQQTLARSQYSDLDSQVREQEVAKAALLAEAQTWREQAVEAERKALSHQKDAERLKEEAKNQKGVLEECTFRIASAREESARIAEQVRRAVEETVGGDLVNLLSLCTRDAS